MKTNLFSTLLLAAALFAACGDDNGPGEKPEPKPMAAGQVVKIEWYNNHTSVDETGSTQQTYDAEGRLLSYADQSGYRIDFAYDDTNHTGRETILHDGQQDHYDLAFNSMWCLTSECWNQSQYKGERSCTYDAEGHILTEEGKDISLDQSTGEVWTTTYTWANGNIVRIDEKYASIDNGTVQENEWHTETTLLEYYDTLNPFADAWVDPVIVPYYDYFGMGMRGRHCRNLVKSIVTPATDGEKESTATFEYTFDDQGRIIRCDYSDDSEQDRYDIYTYAE